MSTADEPGPGEGPRRARRGPTPPTPVTVNPARAPSPTDRLETMARERIEALEADRRDLRSDVRRLQDRVDELGPKVSRLEEALDNAESNGVMATALVAGGGFLVSYATFTGKAATSWANVAAGCLLAGIGTMLWQSARRRRRR